MKFRFFRALTLISAVIIVVGFALSFSACDNGSPGVTTYTVTFETSGGSTVSSQTVEEGALATRPANPTKSGFTFDGWYSGAELQTVYDFDIPVTRNITLYAKWLTPYTVTFNSNGGSEVADQIIGEGNTASRPQNPTKTGFAIVGWFIDEALTTEYDFNTPVTQDITLYAKWTDSYYIVTFNSMGGSAVESQNVAHNGTATRPDNPVLAGSGFFGWFTDIGLTIEYDFNTPVTADITLYAKWGEGVVSAPEDIDDFGAGAIINNEFTVSNTSEWANAISVINSSGNGTETVNKNYIINITGDFSISGIENTWSNSTNPSFTPSFIKISLRSNNCTLSLSSIGAIFLLNNNQNIIIRDLTLKGLNLVNDGLENSDPLIYVRNSGCTLELKGDTAITGNSRQGGSSAVQFYTQGTFIMHDNSKIHGNTGTYAVYLSNASFIMQNDSSIFGNSGRGVDGSYGSYTIIMQDNASIYNNTDSPPNPDNGIIYSGGIAGATLTMQDNAKIYGNSGRGVDGGGVTMRDYAEISGNNGGGVRGSVDMSDNAKITGNTLTIIFPHSKSTDGGAGVNFTYQSIVMSGNSEISNNTLTLIAPVDNTSISGEFGGGGLFATGFDGNVTMNGSAKITDNTMITIGTLTFGGIYITNIGGGGVFGNVYMNDNASITGNTTPYNGGGVFGKVEMSGQTIISNNTASIGGGIFTYLDNNVVLRENARITGNNANLGGGIGTTKRSYFTIQDNTSIDNNTASDTGGGVYISNTDDNFATSPAMLIIKDNAGITNNTALSAGGLYCYETEVIMQNYASIKNNSANGDYARGGGVMLGADCSFVMQNNSTISGNTTDGENSSGGGVYVSGSTFIMQDDTSIENNTSSGNNSVGGGIYISGMRYLMFGGVNAYLKMYDNAKLSGNTAQRGGGIYISIVESYSGNLFMFGNAEISYNTASIEGGGVYTRPNTNLRISGGTIYGNSEGDNSNMVKNASTSINGKGASLFKETNAVTQYGTFNEDGETFTSNGNLSTTDNTIRVENGVLQP